MKQESLSETDEFLWEAFKTGNESAFAELYSRYFQYLFSYGSRIGGLSDDAVCDTIQDLFLDLWRTRNQLGQAETVKFYLLRSLRRKIYRTVKKDSPFGERLDGLSDDLVPVEFSTETHIMNDEAITIQSERLAVWLDQLPSRQNEALVLHYFHNLSYREIAAILEIKEQTARNLVQKGLSLIRRSALWA